MAGFDIAATDGSHNAPPKTAARNFLVAALLSEICTLAAEQGFERRIRRELICERGSGEVRTWIELVPPTATRGVSEVEAFSHACISFDQHKIILSVDWPWAWGPVVTIVELRRKDVATLTTSNAVSFTNSADALEYTSQGVANPAPTSKPIHERIFVRIWRSRERFEQQA